MRKEHPEPHPLQLLENSVLHETTPKNALID